MKILNFFTKFCCYKAYDFVLKINKTYVRGDKELNKRELKSKINKKITRNI